MNAYGKKQENEPKYNLLLRAYFHLEPVYGYQISIEFFHFRFLIWSDGCRS